MRKGILEEVFFPDYKKSSKVSLLLFLIIILSTGRCEALELWVTNPWLSMLTRFIGGVQVVVNPVLLWGETGETIKVKKAPPDGAIVLSLDRQEALSILGKDFEERFSPFFLYERLSSGSITEESFMDPAALPFIGLRTLQILSECDPEQYDYFQRRLAEFQARLDSTVIVGRNMIGKSTILDLSWKFGRWLQAAAGTVIRPPSQAKDGWSRGEGIDVLETAIEEARKQKWIIVSDPWTPKAVLERVRNIPGFIELQPPRTEGDMILFLYDQYLRIWDHIRRVS